MAEVEEKEGLLTLPVLNVVNRILYHSSHEVIDRFCVEIVSESRKLLNGNKYHEYQEYHKYHGNVFIS